MPLADKLLDAKDICWTKCHRKGYRHTVYQAMNPDTDLVLCPRHWVEFFDLPGYNWPEVITSGS